MARTAGECMRMISAFQEAKLPLYCGYYRRYLPKFLAVRDALPQLGGISEVRVRLTQTRYTPGEPVLHDWRTDPEVAGGGLFMDLASHQLDLLDWLLGPLFSVTGMASRVAPVPTPAGDAEGASTEPPAAEEGVQLIATAERGASSGPPRRAAEDNVRLMATTRDGVLVSGSWNFAAPERADEIEIMGPLAAVRFSTFNDMPPVITDVSGESTPLVHEPQHEHVHYPIVCAIVKDLLKRREDPTAKPKCSATGLAAARTNLVLDAVLEKYYGGRALSPPYWLDQTALKSSPSPEPAT
mmetsp:Transcript_36377/g.114037  ORF Transcript_36377/g.114037 Transcript_36377/m.114037 type:complete len:297 (-) Transcript_36377:173-1063(-)